MSQTQEQKLLSKLYECHDIILTLSENDEEKEKHIIISELISYIEKKIIHDAGFVGL
jgi:hypothetical protein